MHIILNNYELTLLTNLYTEINSDPEIKLNDEQKKLVKSILKRLKTYNARADFKKEHMVSMQQVMHQALEFCELIAAEQYESMEQADKKAFAAQNNIMLVLMDKINQKLGIEKNSAVNE